ncbi:hypothetical protein D3C79_861540 [compost metagenome]
MLERQGHVHIVLAWLADTRRVVMAQDQRRRVMQQGTAHHLPRVDTGPVDRPPEQDLERQRPVLGIQKKATKYFTGLMAQHGLEVPANGRWVIHGGITLNAGCKVPAPDFQ